MQDGEVKEEIQTKTDLVGNPVQDAAGDDIKQVVSTGDEAEDQSESEDEE